MSCLFYVFYISPVSTPVCYREGGGGLQQNWGGVFSRQPAHGKGHPCTLNVPSFVPSCLALLHAFPPRDARAWLWPLDPARDPSPAAPRQRFDPAPGFGAGKTGGHRSPCSYPQIVLKRPTPGVYSSAVSVFTPVQPPWRKRAQSRESPGNAGGLGAGRGKCSPCGSVPLAARRLLWKRLQTPLLSHSRVAA